MHTYPPCTEHTSNNSGEYLLHEHHCILGFKQRPYIQYITMYIYIFSYGITKGFDASMHTYMNCNASCTASPSPACIPSCLYLYPCLSVCVSVCLCIHLCVRVCAYACVVVNFIKTPKPTGALGDYMWKLLELLFSADVIGGTANNRYLRQQRREHSCALLASRPCASGTCASAATVLQL